MMDCDFDHCEKNTVNSLAMLYPTLSGMAFVSVNNHVYETRTMFKFINNKTRIKLSKSNWHL